MSTPLGRARRPDMVPVLMELQEWTQKHQEASLDDETFIKAKRLPTPKPGEKNSLPSPGSSSSSAEHSKLETKTRSTSMLSPRSPKSQLAKSLSTSTHDNAEPHSSITKSLSSSGSLTSLVLTASAANKFVEELGLSPREATPPASPESSTSSSPGRFSQKSARKHYNPIHPDYPFFCSQSPPSPHSPGTPKRDRSLDDSNTPREKSRSLAHGFLQYTGLPTLSASESPSLLRRQSSILTDPFDLCTAYLIQLAFKENLIPNILLNQSHKEVWRDRLKPYLEQHLAQGKVPDRCPDIVKGNISRLHECQQMIGEGLAWKAADQGTMRLKSFAQLWRGLRQYESITINGLEIPSLLSDKDKIGYDETRPAELEEIPEKIRMFYHNLFGCLAAQQFPFAKLAYQESLKRLLKHKDSDKDRDIRMFLSMTSMDMWGCCSNFLREKFPRLFDEEPYITIHDRIGKLEGIGVPGATKCEMIVLPGDIRLIQKKKFRSGIKATGMMLQDKPIATFTLAWNVPLPERGAKFQATLTMSDFAWHPEATFEEKEAYIGAFLNLKQGASTP